MLWVALHFPGLATGRLAPLAAWACQFTPRVSLEPDALLLEVEASLRYFGGRDALLAALESGLRELGLAPSHAIGPTSRAALWRASGGGLPLEDLPISIIGDEEAFFKQIEIAP